MSDDELESWYWQTFLAVSALAPEEAAKESERLSARLRRSDAFLAERRQALVERFGVEYADQIFAPAKDERDRLENRFRELQERAAQIPRGSNNPS